ncbi:MAG: SusD/RagB family nutrient-binding outer membrane lipoprotein [Reichenbachiella sp.]|uniref:SusD/RagB family nutrient-binding outer membrane lipoprotein n=1 Tax=Reichenbachiella sp. TaxID=2184521 RepID=UPI003299E127
MKFKINYKILSLCLLTIFAVSACTDDFEEMNTNPNGPVVIPSDLVLAGIIETTADRLFDTFHGGDMATWSQQFGKVQYNDEERYSPRATVLNNTWNGFFSVGLTDAKEMAVLARAEGNEANIGVAYALQAYLYSLLVEMYGPIPFTESILASEGNTTPAYDDEQTVYEGCIALLDSAVTKLQGEGTISAAQDIMYEGDAGKWMKFANSLKFRLLMRMASAGENVSSDLQAVVNSGVHFTSNDDNAQLNYLSTNPNANPLWNDVIFGTRSEWKINQTIVQLMEGLADPRLNVYAQPNDAGIIRGVAPGIINPTINGFDYVNTSALGEYILAPDAPGVFMSYSELMFLVAEAAKRGYISGGDATAQASYEAGIAASFDTYNGFKNADGSTIAIDATSYMSSSAVAYSSATALTQIATQNYIALFGQGQEAYTEWRRTKIPVLPSIADPLADLAGDGIPTRYTYPTDEQTLNAANYNAASKMLDGGDELDSPLWFMN